MTSAPTASIDLAPQSGALALAFEAVDVCYRVRGHDRPVLRDLTFRIEGGQAYGLVGESGCGKSTAALAAMHYLPHNGRVARGRVSVGGQDLALIDAAGLRHLRQGGVAMVYQDPGRALNPSIKIGRQIEEIFEFGGEARETWRERTLGMLEKVRISDPKRVAERFPHQLSGGMQQRVCIAMALARNPSLLILDEPTTGLDVTVEAEVLDLVQQLRAEFATSILFISHNLAIVARMCERVGVLYAGRLVEEGPVADIFREPAHPYTIGLLRSLPRAGRRKADGPLDAIPGLPPPPGAILAGCVFAARCQLADETCRTREPEAADLGGRFSRCHYLDRARSELRPAPRRQLSGETDLSREKTILEIVDLSKTFTSAGQALRALSDVSLSLRSGETLGLVGESGSGKTTFARALLGLVEADTQSAVLLDGQRLAPKLRDRPMSAVKSLQIVFQNPDSALNRSHSIRQLIGRAVRRLAGLPASEVAQRTRELARAVLLPERHLAAKPRQLSGGLKQRVAIARAFAGEPRVVVCDEPTSALDVSVQAAILNLLADLQSSRKVSYIFISHDLGVVRYLSDRIAVLYLGRLMQIGSAEAVFSGPHHPYTEALLSAVPDLSGRQPERIHLAGEIPSAINPPSGCVFHTRCPRKIAGLCDVAVPPFAETAHGEGIRCHIPPAELRALQGGKAVDPSA